MVPLLSSLKQRQTNANTTRAKVDENPYLSCLFHSSSASAISLFRPIKLLINQMQQQVHIKSHAILEEIHVLMVGELRSQQRVHGNLGTGPGNLDASFTTFYEEHSNLVA
jgi:hypothetical protein